uniref:EF-hand domain-containing protein n=1 Tax=Fagus sylvatica TaxID=28930 RepID=A0A2N9IK77_FAGSY
MTLSVGKQWRQEQVRKITDKVFDRLKNQSGTANLKFEDLYIAVLLVYNDINKRLPGPHFDPPSKDQVREMIKECDFNLDGEIDREEFLRLFQQLTSDTLIAVSQGLILTLVVAPTVAMATKRATEGVPGVGKVVQRLPHSVYASIVTLAVVLFQQSLPESK